MKFTQRIKALLLATFFAVFFITGCSLFETSLSGFGKIEFRIDEKTAFRSLTEEEKEGLYVEIKLKGGYTAKETLFLAEETKAVFEEIPIGTKLYAEASAYKIENDERIIFYTGKSEEITIQEGENPISLKMRKAEVEEPEAEAGEAEPVEAEEAPESEPETSLEEITVTITIEESSDITVTVDKDETDIDKGIIVYTFTAEEGYDSYTWKLDGEEVYPTVANIFKFSTQGWITGTYDISLITKKVIVEATEESPAEYEYYSYEAHLAVEK